MDPGWTFIDRPEGFEQTGKCEKMCLVHASSFADMNLDIFCVLALFKSLQYTFGDALIVVVFPYLHKYRPISITKQWLCASLIYF